MSLIVRLKVHGSLEHARRAHHHGFVFGWVRSHEGCQPMSASAGFRLKGYLEGQCVSTRNDRHNGKYCTAIGVRSILTKSP